MSTDSIVLEKGTSIQQRRSSKNPFGLKSAGPQEIDWLSGVLPSDPVSKNTTTVEEPWIKVAPDFYVKKSEYQRRFAEVDLDYYRQRMTPKLFTAFVRHMGVVPGSPGLDVVELTTLPDF